MKADIINGILEIYPSNETEEYALDCWFGINVNQCTRETNGKNISFCSCSHPRGKYIYRLKRKIQILFLHVL